ncbi:FAD-dependent oxidoreductase [Streptomyces sp. DH12]|uniref:FAD-dependent oxidoreductase n=1 Tax=Streptomyces sp. DH12 TaxID=2857010 RepID=UPI001E4EAD12|nr:FAD-dependent oxidoreductase [Streptomyces sp. DH12]
MTSRVGPPAPHETDLVVVGGGPAGCAAARMAASVGMRSVLVEAGGLCRGLRRIPVLDNALGGHGSGPELADAVAAELARTELCRLLLGRRAVELRAGDDRVTVTLDTGARVGAPYAVVATGVAPLQPRDVDWVTAPAGLTLPPLWEADASDAVGRTLLVLGGDRPIGTFLRAHPAADTRLLVAFPRSDDHKVEEVHDDPRVTLLPVGRLTLRSVEGRVAAEISGRSGGRRPVEADAVFLSIGGAPTAPDGDLVRDGAGYCRPSDQHPRVIVAGDLRSARFQRVMTAMGSGSEAALRAYYAGRGLAVGE